ncbi:Hypothetical protein PP7435_CHR2-0507 [Komagataella phaffii CBS 7435]|nr:Hypothetical protein BQ9382_C2-2786 [Komagataella phaffii CBS 7435]CCA38195.1 Hypothetical protein PP7435_CHR2-0507 [Komagataella phaffii CBS 7435]
MLTIFLQEPVLTNSSLSTSDTRQLIYQQQTIKIDDMIVFFLPTRMQKIHRQNSHNNEISISILLKQRRRSRTQPFFEGQKAVRKSDFGAPLPVDSFKAPPSVVKDLFEDIRVKPKNDETNEFHEKLACRLDDFFNQLKGVEFIILLYFDDNEHDTSKCPVPKHYDHVIHQNISSHSLLENSKYDRVSSTDFRLINAKAYWINTEKTIKRRELSEVRIEGVAASNATFVPTTIANSAEIRDCVKLTWHNVLHHSIFGRPTNFCHS